MCPSGKKGSLKSQCGGNDAIVEPKKRVFDANVMDIRSFAALTKSRDAFSA
jgi:hypothetical protein